METTNKVVCLWSGSQHASSQVNVDRWIHGRTQTHRLRQSTVIHFIFLFFCSLPSARCLSFKHKLHLYFPYSISLCVFAPSLPPSKSSHPTRACKHTQKNTRIQTKLKKRQKTKRQASQIKAYLWEDYDGTIMCKQSWRSLSCIPSCCLVP